MHHDVLLFSLLLINNYYIKWKIINMEISYYYWKCSRFLIINYLRLDTIKMDKLINDYYRRLGMWYNEKG